MENKTTGSRRRPRPRVPLAERKRTPRACVQCRTNKRRCTSYQGETCTFCHSRNQDCTFEPLHAAPATIQLPLPQLSSTKEALPLCEDVLQQFAKIHPEISLQKGYAQTLRALLHNALTSHQKEQVQTQQPEGQRTCSSPLVAGRSTRLAQPVLTVLDRHHTRAIEGSTFLDIASNAISEMEVNSATVSWQNPVQKRHEVYYIAHRKDVYANQIREQPLDDSANTLDMDDLILKQVLSQIPQREIADPLLDTFFQYCEGLYYYFDKTWFLNAYDEFYATPWTASRVTCDFTCLLLVVLALASQFTHLNWPVELSIPIQNVPMDETPGLNYFRLAQKLMPAVLMSCSLESVQVFLIAALYLLPGNDRDPPYIYLGLALRMAITNCMHRKALNQALSPRLLEVRNRVFWTVYTIERRVSIALNRPEALSRKDVDTPFPRFHIDLDDMDKSSRLKRLLAITHLTEFCDRMFTFAQEGKITSHYEELKSSLFAWNDEHNIVIPPIGSGGFRPAVHLELNYNLVFVYMGQLEVVNTVRQYIRKPHQLAQGACWTSKASLEVYWLCVNAACRMVDLIESLLGQDQLALYSFTDFHCCSSAVIVLFLDSILHPTGESFRRIKIAMLCLKHIARGCASAKNGMHLIEEFQALVERATGSLCPTDLATNMQTETPTDLGQYNELVEATSAFDLGIDSSQPEQFNNHEIQRSSLVGVGKHVQGFSALCSPGTSAILPSTSIDYDYLGSDFSSDLLTSIEQYSQEDLMIYGFSGMYTMFQNVT